MTSESRQWLWFREHSAVTVTELLQPLDLACGTLFRSSCAIQISPTDCSDDSWRDTFFENHEHGTLWLLICGALEKHLLTYLLLLFKLTTIVVMCAGLVVKLCTWLGGALCGSGPRGGPQTVDRSLIATLMFFYKFSLSNHSFSVGRTLIFLLFLSNAVNFIVAYCSYAALTNSTDQLHVWCRGAVIKHLSIEVISVL